MYHVYFVDEPHAYKIDVPRQINPEDVTVTWYGDEERTDEKEYDNGNMISARVVITIDDEVLFDQLEPFVRVLGKTRLKLHVFELKRSKTASVR